MPIVELETYKTKLFSVDLLCIYMEKQKKGKQAKQR